MFLGLERNWEDIFSDLLLSFIDYMQIFIEITLLQPMNTKPCVRYCNTFYGGSLEKGSHWFQIVTQSLFPCAKLQFD